MLKISLQRASKCKYRIDLISVGGSNEETGSSQQYFISNMVVLAVADICMADHIAGKFCDRQSGISDYNECISI